MKKYLLIILTFTQFSHACELLNNKNYDFSYTINDNILNYKIISKYTNLHYFKEEVYKGFPRELGFSVKNDPIIYSIKNNKSIKNNLNLEDKFDLFYKEEDKLYSLMNTGTPRYFFDRKYPLDEKKFHITSTIEESINLNNFFSIFQTNTSNDYIFGTQVIKFKVKLILNPHINSCLVFETAEINYDFGWKLKAYLRNIMNISLW